MPPKLDPNEVRIVVLKTVGGEIAAAVSLAPKVGPLGLSPKKVGEDIRDATMDWRGIKVHVQLTVQNRVAKVSIIPAASSECIKALGEPPRDRKKVKNVKHSGSLSWETIKQIAKKVQPRSCARTFEGVVKEVLGSALSVGCKVEGKSPKDILVDLKKGELDLTEP
mmetsp:Transcript_14559/g.27099  ORF Transcript_14559/g.27099 Transcript_14559/m.27099 type:complete len:166 (-) Transcript_14559:28-525(-)